MLDLDNLRWELGRFGKLNVHHGKGSRRRGPKPRLVPLINGAVEAGCKAVPYPPAPQRHFILEMSVVRSRIGLTRKPGTES